MNWKLRLSLVVVIILVAVIWIKLPSQAGNNPVSSPNEDENSLQQDRVTRYENGIVRILPQHSAVTGAVRDMPKTDPDSLVNRANFVEVEKLREERKEKKSKQEAGIFALDDDEEEINELNSERIRKIIPGAGLADSVFEDPLLKKQRSFLNSPESPQTMPTPSLTFNGASQTDNASQGIGGLLPPDVNGDVGPNHYVSSVNLVLKMFNKSGAVVAGPIKTSALFASLPAGDPCRTLNSGDPIVLYDSLADRWHISQFGTPTNANVNYQCVALSKTGDPTGEYYVWSYAYPLTAFNDYPKVGVWSDGYHMTFNQFSLDGRSQLGLGILTQDRKKALIGDPNAGAVYTNIGDFDKNTGGALPGDVDGFVAPPVGLAEVIGEYRSTEAGDPVDGVRMYKWVPNFDNPANSSLTVLGDVKLADFDGRYPSGRLQVEQLGGSNLDAIPDRSMHRFAYRNFGTTANPINSYVGNFSVNVSGVNPTTAATYQTGIRWFEMRRSGDTFSVFDQGTHNLTPGDGANGLNNWMGSIAQDNRGDIAVGFSQAGTTQRADIKIAGRTNNVENSGTLNEGEALFHAATGSQIAPTNGSAPSGRWGDYSAMNVDPADDCTFWYTQEYYATSSTSGWSTRVGKFRYPQCVDAPKAVIQGTVTNCATGATVSGASIDVVGGFNRLTNADGTFSLTASPATYSFSVSRAGYLSSSSQSVTVGAGQTQAANVCLVPTAAFSATGSPQILSESCGISNNTPEPGEQVTVALPLQNTGAAATANLTATLQTGNGVINPSAAQNFGVISPNGGSVTKNFTFTVDPTLGCGAVITLTFNITDGTTNFGTVKKTYTTGTRIQTFSENFDGVTPPALPANWSSTQLVGTVINWTTETAMPSSTPNNAFANDANTKSTAALVSPAIQIQTADAQLSFKTFYRTEVTFDGMVLEFSADNGTTWTDIVTGGGSFVSGGYNSFIDTAADSTIRGRLAWTGTSNGYINTVVNLPAALNGKSVRFRWVMASDANTPANDPVIGVRIDDVQVFGARQCNTGCAPTTPDFCQFKNKYKFDSDAKADISVFRPGTGVWYLLNSQSGFTATQFGLSTDKLVPADYDGDGKTDLAVFRDGTWYIQRSTAGFISVPFGLASDIPQPADFDGDCKSDIAVYRPSNGVWYVLNLTSNAVNAVQFGLATDKPVVSDYDGDGKSDYAVYRPSNGTWYLLQSAAGFSAVQFGLAADVPVTGDYDGDGKADEAVYRPDSGTWYILRSRDGFTAAQFGRTGDLPVPADYDGDGKTDIAVYRPDVSTWYQLKTTEGFGAVQFGISTDKPIPNAFVP